MPDPLRVLIVEDNADDALLMVETLRAGGFAPEYLRVDTAEAMRRALADGRWELVLADFKMPHFSGPAALQVLKESGQDIPYIVVSATVTEQQAIDMMRDSAQDFILKQQLARLVPAVRRELREAQIRRERRLAAQALRDERLFLRMVIDTVPNFIGVKDIDSRFVLANRALAAVYGVTPAELIGKSDADFNPNSEEVAWFHRDDVEVITSCRPKHIEEEKVTDSTGQVRWLTTIKVPIIEEDGACHSLLLTTMDITERKQAEEALARERAFLSSAIELLPFPIVFNTPDGAVLRINQAAIRLFGEDGASIWRQVRLLAPDTRAPVPPEAWPMMRAARGEVVPPGEGTLVLPDGRELDVLAVAAPVYIHDEIVATVVAFMDITPIKEADRAKTRFLAILSHELRTPLTNILGWTTLARESPEMAPEALRVIARNADSQRRLLERLLEVTRLLYGRFTLERQPTQLWPLVETALHGLAAEAAERRVTFDVHPPAEPLPIDADRKRLQEAVEGVAELALRASPPGKPVVVAGRRENGAAVLTLRDFGPTPSPAVLEHAFDLFQVTPATAETGGGLGLELPLAKAIAEGHGGRISLTPATDGPGDLVVITLPLEPTP